MAGVPRMEPGTSVTWRVGRQAETTPHDREENQKEEENRWRDSVTDSNRVS
jgi:hypothetical protein